MAQIRLLGAAGEVTGSAYLVETSQARVLVDFGMFQGSQADEERNIIPPELDPHRLDALILTHGHMDHTGRVPMLPGSGFRGPIHATPATIELAELLLYDSARLHASDVKRENTKRLRAGRPLLELRYTEDDVAEVLACCKPLPYEQSVAVAPGISVRMVEAGHVLGSASIQMTIEDAGHSNTVVFSGDIGPRGAPFLRDPGRIEQADLLIMESTYGDRDHRSLAETVAEFGAIVADVVAHNGKLLVPAFAVGRAQQILYHLAELIRNGTVPRFPIFLDSPMATRALDMYFKHTELSDDETLALERSGQLDRDLYELRVTENAEDSKLLNTVDGPCMIIAGSGMCTGGRILHHLKHNLWKPETAVLIVGYQAAGSLGRQLAEKAERVRIYGDEIAVRASIHTLGGFSAHAGQTELLDWLAPMASHKPRIVLTHGEDRGRVPLAAKIQERHGITAQLPTYGAVLSL